MVNNRHLQRMTAAAPRAKITGLEPWLDLTKEHYGIHGTPEPRLIGKSESHGCLRMTNWDVMRLSRMMKPGFQAKFVA